ncbi:hypothetical protein PMAYCL1PPCAC_17841, partial [Pristionchus mayeri]
LRMEDDDPINRPLALILVAQREGQSEETLYMYPFTYCDPPPSPSPSVPPTRMGLSTVPSTGSSIGSLGSMVSGLRLGGSHFGLFPGVMSGGTQPSSGFLNRKEPKEAPRPTIHYPREMQHTQANSMQTKFGISTAMLASILCVKKACLDHVLELKIDNIRFAGYAKEENEEEEKKMKEKRRSWKEKMMEEGDDDKPEYVNNEVERERKNRERRKEVERREKTKEDDAKTVTGEEKKEEEEENEEGEEGMKNMKKEDDRAKISMFGINFILPPNIEQHVICSYQRLAKKLSIAINEMQVLNNYLESEIAVIERVNEELEAEAHACKMSYASRRPYERIREKSLLCQTLAKVYDDVIETGVVQVFIDRLIDVSFCVESRALRFASLPPRSRADLDRLVSHLRPYHGLILLKDVWPNPDPNPSVALLLKHCTPEKSIVDISAATGISILQVLLIVRHLLLWARVIIIYPLSNNNVYTSSTFTKVPLVDPTFMSTEWSEDQIANALAFFNPYATLSKFVDPTEVLVEQQVRGRLMTHLLRHQLVMQLHRYYYLVEPSSRNAIGEPRNPCPDSLKKMIMGTKLLHYQMEECVCKITALQLEKESYSKVSKRLSLFLILAPLLNGQHHIEDMMYTMNATRKTIMNVIDAYSLTIADFLRPDEISALSIY